MKDVRDLAFIDDLTGLFNRRYLFIALSEEIRKAQEERAGLYVAMVDVDSFKQINDNYGHLKGDDTLKEIALILSAGFGQRGTLARYAGDEFTAILKDMDEAEALASAREVLDAMCRHRFATTQAPNAVPLSLSIGISSYPRDGTRPRQLIDLADKALYLSKKKGKNTVSFTKELTKDIIAQASAQEIFPLSCLIDRAAEMKALKEIFAKTSQRTQGVLLSGEEGAGKTRLLGEFRNYAEKNGAFSILCNCGEEMHEQAFGVLLDGFEKAGIPIEGPIDLVFNSILKKIKNILERNKTVLFLVDDLGWADRSSAELLSFLADKAVTKGLILCASMEKREGKFSDSPARDAMKSLLEKEMAEIELGGLNLPAIEEFISAAFPDIEGLDDLSEFIYRHTEGNPLFIEEILKWMLQEEIVYSLEGRWKVKDLSSCSPPRLASEAAKRRFENVGGDARELIGEAAAAGREFSSSVLNKIADKNPGFILDMLEEAKRSGLIKEDATKEEEYKFINELIRRVAYEEQDISNRKAAHLKLAKIEEDKRRGNLKMAAGRLAYHFGRAGDKEKEAVYADMAKSLARQIPSFEEALDIFQKESETELKEAPEVVPLSKESFGAAPDFIRALRSSIVNILLYPATSEIRREVVSEAYDALSAILKNDENIIVSYADNSLLINGQKMEEQAFKRSSGGFLLELMNEHKIESIGFNKGLSREGLASFLECLSMKKKDIPEGGLKALLAEKGVSDIWLNQIHFEVARPWAQKAQERYLSAISGLGEDMLSLLRSPKDLADAINVKMVEAGPEPGDERYNLAETEGILERLASDISRKPDAEASDAKKKFIDLLLSLEPGLKDKVVRSSYASDERIPEYKKIFTQEMRDEDKARLLVEEYKNGAGLSRLRNLAKLLLPAAAQREAISGAFEVQLLDAGMEAKDARVVVKDDPWEAMSVTEKADDLLSRQPDFYLEQDVSNFVFQLISALLQERRDGVVVTIVEKFLSDLRGFDGALRGRLCVMIYKIAAQMIEAGKGSLLDGAVNTIIKLFFEEPDARVSAIMMKVVERSISESINNARYAYAGSILSLLNEAAGRPDAAGRNKKDAVENMARSFSSGGPIDNLTSGLKDALLKGGEYSPILDLLILLRGEWAIQDLIAMAASSLDDQDEIVSFSMRRRLCKVLDEKLHDAACRILIETLSSENRDYIRVSLEMLGNIAGADALKYIKALVKHSDERVASAADAALKKISKRAK